MSQNAEGLALLCALNPAGRMPEINIKCCWCLLNSSRGFIQRAVEMVKSLTAVWKQFSRRVTFTEGYSFGLVWNSCWCCSAAASWAWQTSWLGGSWMDKTFPLGLTSQGRMDSALAQLIQIPPGGLRSVGQNTSEWTGRKWEYELGRSLWCSDLQTEANEMTVESLPCHPGQYFK